MATKIAPLSGFPEWLPPQRMIEQQIIDRVRQSYVNQLVMTRAATHSCAALPALAVGGRSVVSPSDVYYVGNSQGGRVVDPVADHGHAMALAPHFLNRLKFFLWQKTEPVFMDIGDLRGSSSNRFAVAGEHHEPFNP